MENLNKRKLFPSIAAIAFCFGVSTTANATIALFDYDFNSSGPYTLIDTGFDYGTGLGTIGVTITGAGTHSFDAFFDHEIDEGINTYFNETGSATGILATGQSWEIDEPGFVDGDIYCNVFGCPEDTLNGVAEILASSLDNGIGTSVFGDTTFPEDVSMAMGWDFVLALDEMALITFAITDVMPTSGFFLTHHDPDSAESIFLSSSLGIVPSVIPVPAAVWLFGSALVGLIGFNRRKAKA